ncbi:MAG TPA: hypothetical protein VJI67_02665, partial [archaeon]|nr:hypothetical protein [archaeon]
NAGESCIASTQCSTGYCYNSKCAFAPSSTPAASPPSPAPTTPPTPAQEKKTERKGVGEVCTSSVDCLSGKCVNNACVECVEDTDCTQAQQCGLSYECENVSCANGVVENHYCIPRAGTASTQQQPPQKPPQAQATKQQSQPASGTASSPVTSTAQGAPQGNPLTAFASLAPKVTASSVVPPVAYAVIAGLIAWLVFHYLQGRKFPQDAALESAAGAGAVSFLVPWGMSQLMNWTIALVWPGIVAVFLVLLLLTESSAKAGAAALNTQQQV